MDGDVHHVQESHQTFCHFVIEVGRLPSIETVPPSPGNFKTQFGLLAFCNSKRDSFLMVILKDGDTHKSQGGKSVAFFGDTSPHLPLSAKVLETVIPLLLEPKAQGFQGLEKDCSFPVS